MVCAGESLDESSTRRAEVLAWAARRVLLIRLEVEEQVGLRSGELQERLAKLADGVAVISARRSAWAALREGDDSRRPMAQRSTPRTR